MASPSDHPTSIYVCGEDVVSRADVDDIIASLSKPPLGLDPAIVGDRELRDLGWNRYVLAEPTDEMVERLARHICGIPSGVDLEPTDEARARARRHLSVAFGASTEPAEWRAPLPCDAECEGLCFAWLPGRACRAATPAEMTASSTERQERGGVMLSKDRRLIEQSGGALRRVSDWLRDLEHVHVDGRALDALGEVIHAVDQAEDELAASSRKDCS